MKSWNQEPVQRLLLGRPKGAMPEPQASPTMLVPQASPTMPEPQASPTMRKRHWRSLLHLLQLQTTRLVTEPCPRRLNE